MNCLGCSTDNHHGRRYCGKCGARLYQCCAQCGFANGLADAFCGGCGCTVGEAQIATAGRVAAPAAAKKPVLRTLSSQEVSEMFVTADKQPPKVETNQVSQTELDNLFGGG